MARFRGETSAVFAWARTILYLRAGDERGARAALVRARGANAAAEEYLTGRRPVLAEDLLYWSPGQPTESILVGQVLKRAWQATLGAKEMLDGMRSAEQRA